MSTFLLKRGFPLLLFLFFFISFCDENAKQTHTVDLKELPPVLKKIIENNNNIPSFYCKFGLSSRSEGKNLAADGIAYIDKKRSRGRITLVDTLTNETVLDLVRNKNRIELFLYNPEGGILIQGHLKKLRLDRYISNFKMDLKELVHLVSGESLIFSKQDSIGQQENADYLLFRLAQKNRFEMISVKKSTNQVETIALYENGKQTFRIQYKKYVSKKGFYYPMRSDFYHRLTGSRTILYLSDIQFSPRFEDHHFLLKDYPKAKKILDPL